MVDYRKTLRYGLLSNAMKVLLELVYANQHSGAKKRFLTYSELCTDLNSVLSPEEISATIDLLFDRQEISAKTQKRGDIYVRAYAPATELVQRAMTNLFIKTPLEGD